MNELLVRTLAESPEILQGLADQTMTLHGGVVRWAPGTPTGGRIVAHLRLPGDPEQAGKALERLEKMMTEGTKAMTSSLANIEQGLAVLQGLQVANLALSGLNLAVSVAGFVVVCRKLDGISRQLDRHSKQLGELLALGQEAREREMLRDETDFRALIQTAATYCERGDIEHLKGLELPFRQHFEYSLGLLQRHAACAWKYGGPLEEIACVQDRLIHLGLAHAHVQLRVGSVNLAEAMLVRLGQALTGLNQTRYEALTADLSRAIGTPAEHETRIIPLMRRARDIRPALSYQADLLAACRQDPRAVALLEGDPDEPLLLMAA